VSTEVTGTLVWSTPSAPRLQLGYYLWRLAKAEVGTSSEIHAFGEVGLNTRAS
jgi:hypothetical protein